MLRSPALELHDIVKVAKEEFEVDIELDDSLTRKQQIELIIDKVFEAYNRAIVEVESNKFKRKTEKRTNTRKTKSADGKVSRKQYILDRIAEGKYDKAQILDLTDEEYGYKAIGKNSKTRVSKVIRALKAANSLDEAADGVLSLKGK